MGFASTLPLLVALPLAAQVNVLTWQYDNTRAGANRNETTLAPLNVNSTQFGKLFSAPVDGYIYGQPLYFANVAVPGKGTHNVVFVATEHDSVYAFDADNGAALWQVNFLGDGVTTVPNGDVGCDQIVPEIGITSTPVIDPASGTIYVVAMTKETSGGATDYVQRLHALDVTTGAERPASPVAIQAAYPGTGEGGTTLDFQAKNYKQRPGLLLLNGVVYTAWSSHCDIGKYHGWLIGYDAQTLRQVMVYNNTPNGNQGSFWDGGAAPAADDAGNIYLVAGNGTFDYAMGGPDLGEAFIKLASASGLAVEDYFTPFNYANLNAHDQDVGSAGVAFLGDEAGSAAHPHLMAGSGKEGRVYLLDRDQMGRWQAGSDSQIVGSSAAGAIGGLFGNPAYFNHSVYYCGAGDNLKAYAVWDAVLSSGTSSQSAAQFGGLGCVPAISANATANGIVWVLDAAGLLRAYDARNLANELYNSNQNAARDALGPYVKFTVPAVANGKVYAGTQKALVAYGLIPGAPGVTVAANAASAQQGKAAPGSLISIYGTNLAQTTASLANPPFPTTLGGVTVTINGTAAPVFYASPAQINAQVPFETAAGTASVAVTSGGARVAAFTLAISPVAPGLFMVDQGRAAVVNQDGQVNTASARAAVGSEIELYLTGLGAVSPAVADGAAAGFSTLNGTAGVTIGGKDAPVAFAGLAPGYAGLYQVNVIVPQLAHGDYPIAVTVGGVASNTAVLSVE